MSAKPANCRSPLGPNIYTVRRNLSQTKDCVTLPPQPLPAPARLFAGIDLALFLDIDGTLIDLADRPDEVVVAAGLPAMLERLNQRCGGAVALITGRRLDDVDRLFGPLPIVAAGQHGLERRDAEGNVASHAVDRRLMAEIADKLNRFAACHPGTQVEDKGLTVALHYRNAPDTEQAARRFVRETLRGRGNVLTLHDGKKVLEVKPDGVDKGTAVRHMMTEAPFRGRTPVYLGDDVTDEDGFVAVNEMNGISIEVGLREPTVARYRLAGVDEALRLLDWLDRRGAGLEMAGSVA